MQADGSVFNAALRELKISFWGCLATVSRPLHSCRKYTEESTKLHEKCRTQLLFLLPFTLPAPSFTIFSGCNLPSTSYRSESVTLCNLPATCMQCRQGSIAITVGKRDPNAGKRTYTGEKGGVSKRYFFSCAPRAYVRALKNRAQSAALHARKKSNASSKKALRARAHR